MHKKDNSNKSRNFIQGLRPLSSSLPHGLKKILKKGGYNFSNIVDNWTKMVGKEIATSCYPGTVKAGKNIDNGILILKVIHGNELKIEYNKQEIMDKINSFFGYQYIREIKLSIIRERKELKKENNFSNKIMSNFNSKIKNIQNSDLKNSLDKLIRAFNGKNN
jgi:hypothetical protein